MTATVEPVPRRLTRSHPILVGIAEIAQRLEVKRQTVDKWRALGILPKPRWLISGNPVWDWEQDIVPWAVSTKRMKAS